MFDRRKQPKNQAFGAAFIFLLKIIVDFPQRNMVRHDMTTHILTIMQCIIVLPGRSPVLIVSPIHVVF